MSALIHKTSSKQKQASECGLILPINSKRVRAWSEVTCPKCNAIGLERKQSQRVYMFAPELLETIKDLLVELEGHCKDFVPSADWAETNKVIRRARKAIAKAEGDGV